MVSFKNPNANLLTVGWVKKRQSELSGKRRYFATFNTHFGLQSLRCWLELSVFWSLCRIERQPSLECGGTEIGHVFHIHAARSTRSAINAGQNAGEIALQARRHRPQEESFDARVGVSEGLTLVVEAMVEHAPAGSP